MLNFSGLSNGKWWGKAMRAPLRLVPDDATVRVLQGPLQGMKWVAGAATHGCWLGSYEADKQRRFAKFIRPGMKIFDVGANVGFYTLLSSRLVGPAGQVHAFEPLPRNLGLLRQHLRLNGIANVRIWENAAGSAPGSVDFHIGANPMTGHVGGAGGETIRVEVVSLDSLAETSRIPLPNLIKCDIEGAEGDFLLGAKSVIHRSKPVLFLATHGPAVHRTCCELLHSWGYGLESLDSRRLKDTDEILALPGKR
jgi:FkbM family methyltransferase